MIQFEVQDIEDLPLDLDDIRASVLAQALSKTAFFKQISKQELARVARITDVELFRTHDIIFREGDFGDKMYIVVEGKVSLQIGGKQIAMVTSVTERSWFGELALLNSSRRTATAECVEITKVLSVSRDNFRVLLEMMPSLKSLFKTNAAAMKEMNKLNKHDDSMNDDDADDSSMGRHRPCGSTLDMSVDSFQGARACVVVDVRRGRRRSISKGQQHKGSSAGLGVTGSPKAAAAGGAKGYAIASGVGGSSPSASSLQRSPRPQYNSSSGLPQVRESGSGWHNA